MSDQKNEPSDVDELSVSDASEPEEQPNPTSFDPELDHDDQEDGDVREVVAFAPATETPFSLKGGGSAFSHRSHSIFDKLDSAFQRTSSSLSSDRVTDVTFVLPLPPCSILKKSQAQSASSTPPPKKACPDYLVHPERWTHYSLEDVTETNDKDNRRAAHQFLSSLREDRPCDPPCDIQERMIFSRPNQLPKIQTADQPSAVRANKRGMHLSHLEEEEGWLEGRKNEKTGGKGTEQDEEDTETNIRPMGQPEEEKNLQTEKGEEVKTEFAKPGFTSFRRPKSQNFRKSSEQEEN